MKLYEILFIEIQHPAGLLHQLHQGKNAHVAPALNVCA